MNRVYIKTYGCQMNERDSEQVASDLRNRGYSIVDTEHDADVVLLNTCSVRDQAEQKAIGKAGYLKKKKKENPNFVLGVMGCMAQNHGSTLVDRLPDLDLVVGTQKFHRVPDHLDNLIQSLNGQGPRPSSIVDLDEEEGSQNTIRDHIGKKGQVSAFVSIMQGCNMNCAFCIVPKTRGRERARPIEEIVDEVTRVAESGVKEVTLLGQIVTSYGRREFPVVGGKSPFVQLLEKIQDVKGIERIRFTSPHPRGFKQDLVEAYRDLSKLCEYVHLPLQAGCNKTLRAMNRPYTKERYREIVDSLRAVVPSMYFSTDIIVGFPGETEADFAETAAFFDDIAFDMAYIFKYSIRTGTPAEVMPDQIPQEEKERRNQVLLDLLHKSSLARNEGLVGKTEQVLIEGPAKKGDKFVGKTRGYRNAIFDANERLIGQLVDMKINRATASTVYGDLVLAGVDA
ncbi:tRNA (N6-isopentenyl adenosine(37)-C2)-methylthiotransferase MiaB [Pelagicoccus sp. NFK12]|uniref:tRNA-2-methylthio-N(6)-dimethylallyladenosine synthase n=1 Tax=Pelagicoccus enzymogenes TaxID=2773457 RepID=A0A927IIH8_9BACT|nr:tRNA (N6-isopentenyl adenosine(37)-C2)-methylthiotransferase MiaB [Pelagicoccus enzymogenes]MBD5780778.1 tRNA (N6-isopentenyl adenosine(37)-C2)-methylthiotransferase MiaB [Pelagicoccus enzymogenes]MDQ8200456.1 tRNA (N6-isopentenyl adenosine(37)-C2)-methylthiotransferase MiaB [Pelagicoccus enzymogenes]